MKYLDISLIKYEQELQTEKYKMLMNETKEDPGKWRDTVFMD